MTDISLDTRITQPAYLLSDPSDYPGAIYASIRVHKNKHQREVSLLILYPDRDYIVSEPCADVADAEAYALELGALLVTGCELSDKVDERRQNEVTPTPVAEAAPFAIGDRVKWQACRALHSPRTGIIVGALWGMWKVRMDSGYTVYLQAGDLERGG